MKDLKIVDCKLLHKTIYDFISTNKIIIGDYDDIKDCILSMIRSGYMFNMDRTRLANAMEDLTYMLCPTDDINKDRVCRGLEYEISDDEFDDDEGDEDDEDDDGDDDLSGGIEEISNLSEEKIQSVE